MPSSLQAAQVRLLNAQAEAQEIANRHAKAAPPTETELFEIEAMRTMRQELGTTSFTISRLADGRTEVRGHPPAIIPADGALDPEAAR